MRLTHSTKEILLTGVPLRLSIQVESNRPEHGRMVQGCADWVRITKRRMGVAIASRIGPDLGTQSKMRRVLDSKIEQQIGASISISGAHRLAMTWHEYHEATKHSVESLSASAADS